ncbi:MAG: carboxymuconolactone decarboxylase family protein [Actinomycetes bacterium]
MTLRIDLPDDREPIAWIWGEAVPEIGNAAARYSAAVYNNSTLSLREFECARARIAQINHCVFCLDWRTERDGERVEESMYDQVANWRYSSDLSNREQLAAEYAERFAVEHLSLDADEVFWTRMRSSFSDTEVLELSMSIGSWIAFGRLNHVLGIDSACSLPAH